MGKIRILLLIVTLAGLTARCAQKKTSVYFEHSFSNPFVADSITYDFINAALSQKFKTSNFACENVTDRFLYPLSLTAEDSLTLVSMDSLFTKADIEFIYTQLERSESFKLNHKLVEGRHVIQFDSVLANKEKYSVEGFCNISMPVFTHDMATAIVEKGMVCGRICGEIETLIYRRTKGEWKLIYTLVDSVQGSV